MENTSIKLHAYVVACTQVSDGTSNNLLLQMQGV